MASKKKYDLSDLEEKTQNDVSANEDSKMNSIVDKTPTTAPTKKAKETPKKERCKIYSCWVDKEELASWKAYIQTKNIKSENLGIYAIRNYIDKVAPITKAEQEEYKKNLAAALAEINQDGRKKK